MRMKSTSFNANMLFYMRWYILECTLLCVRWCVLFARGVTDAVPAAWPVGYMGCRSQSGGLLAYSVTISGGNNIY